MRPLLLLVALSVVACDRFTPPPPTSGPGPVATVVIRPDSATLIAEDTLLLTAVARDSQGVVVTDAVVTWTSDDSDVVAVSATGMAIAVSAGHARIQAAVGAIADSVPLTVGSISYRALAAGDWHTCAVGNNHRAYCWGTDSAGRLGVVPAVLQRPTPTAVASGAVFATLTAASVHTCGLGTDSLIRCWGGNDVGELGTGAPSASALPALTASPVHYVGLSAGGVHTCGLTTTGLVLCWGGNAMQELGGATGAFSATPGVADDAVPFTQVTAGRSHTCAVSPSGDVVCWGSDSVGQRGDSLAIGTAPTTVLGGHTFTLVAAGGAHTCALETGSAYCWGSNGQGESGSGLPDPAVVAPAAVQGGLRFAALSLGADFTCGLTVDSLAYCWGGNARGQIGDGSQTDRPAPTAVSGGHQFLALTAGALHVCGLTPVGTVYCWGDGTLGQLGLPIVPPLKTTPTLIPFPP